MNKCPYCSEENSDDSIACKHCGRAILHPESQITPNEPTTTVDKKEINKGHSFLERIRKSIEKIELYEFFLVTICLIILSLIGVAIAFISGQIKDSPILFCFLMGFLTLGAIFGIFIAYWIYRLAIISSRSVLIRILFFVSGCISVFIPYGLIALAGSLLLFELNRLLMSKLLYKGDTEVETLLKIALKRLKQFSKK